MRDFRVLNWDFKRKIFLYMMPILLQKDVNLEARAPSVRYSIVLFQGLEHIDTGGQLVTVYA